MKAQSNVVANAAIAAKWWADQLRGPEPETDPVLLELMAMGIGSDAPLPGSVILAFERKLEEVITQRQSDLIYMDNDPCPVLREAVDAVGIPATRLPNKTAMYVAARRVRLGYDGEWGDF